MADERPKTGRQLDATGETVRRNIRWIRNARGISGAELSDRVGRLGRSIPLLGIQRIEAGTRRVDVDDLAVLAVALDVSPASLLMPLRRDGEGAARDSAVPNPGDDVQPDDKVAITGWLKPLDATWVWGWLTAANPLVAGYLGSFVALAWPSWEREQFDVEAYQQIQKQKRDRTRRSLGSDGES